MPRAWSDRLAASTACRRARSPSAQFSDVIGPARSYRAGRSDSAARVAFAIRSDAARCCAPPAHQGSDEGVPSMCYAPSRHNTIQRTPSERLTPGLTRRVLARAAACRDRVSRRKQRQEEKPAHRTSGRCAPCVLCSYLVTGQDPVTGSRRGERLGISIDGCKPGSLACLRAL